MCFKVRLSLRTNFGYLFTFFPDVREMIGFAAATATASPLSGYVTRKTIAWTGVTRKTARRRKRLHLNQTPLLVLAVTTGNFGNVCFVSNHLLFMMTFSAYF